MAAINITNVAIINNLAVFQSPFQIQINFECLREELPDSNLIIQPSIGKSSMWVRPTTRTMTRCSTNSRSALSNRALCNSQSKSSFQLDATSERSHDPFQRRHIGRHGPHPYRQL